MFGASFYMTWDGIAIMNFLFLHILHFFNPLLKDPPKYI